MRYLFRFGKLIFLGFLSVVFLGLTHTVVRANVIKNTGNAIAISYSEKYDLNDDGEIGVSDLRLLLHFWGMKKVLSAGLIDREAASRTEFANYPMAEAGYTRHVIFLPSREDSYNYLVELVVGKKMMVDCNSHSLSGNVVSELVPGNRLYFYKVKDYTGQVTSTKMGCPDNSTTEKFIELVDGRFLTDYTGWLPIVFYTPQDLEVRYSVWKRNGQEVVASKQ